MLQIAEEKQHGDMVRLLTELMYGESETELQAQKGDVCSSYYVHVLCIPSSGYITLVSITSLWQGFSIYSTKSVLGRVYVTPVCYCAHIL